MKMTLVQPFMNVTRPIKQQLSYYCKFNFYTIKNVWYLIQTRAPVFVITQYLLSRLKRTKILARYEDAQQQFHVEKSALDLSQDWFTHNLPFWYSTFKAYHFDKKRQITALEIGSWEGLSSYFLLHTFPQATLTCVDTWQGADEHQTGQAVTMAQLNQAESRFNKNLLIYKDRLTKYKGTSFSFFFQTDKNENYDFIYVDGSHHVDDVMLDAIKAFEMLKVGGIMIFDDYFWQYYKNKIDNPAGAINAFLRMKKGSYRIINIDNQVIIEKTQHRTKD